MSAAADPAPAPDGGAADPAPGPNGAALGRGCAYDAIVAGVTADQLRHVIEQYVSGVDGANSPRARAVRRAAVLAYLGPGWEQDGWHDASEGPVSALRAAHHYDRPDLVRVMLEMGANATTDFDPPVTSFELAIYHGLADVVRSLISNGRHRADERLSGVFARDVDEDEDEDEDDVWSTPVHLATMPSATGWYHGCYLPARLDVLEVLVREFGADINARDSDGATPLHWVAKLADEMPDAEGVVRALVALGADLEAGDDEGETALFDAAFLGTSIVPLLLELGASANALDQDGRSPLIGACASLESNGASTNVPLLLRASSPETRRTVESDGKSALDSLLERTDTPPPAWCRDAILELVRSGVPVHPDNVPHAARFGALLAGRAAARERTLPTWRRHDMMVQLAFEFKERRAVEAGLRRREARVAELERLLAEAGIESSSSSSEESDSESDGDDEESSGGDDEGIGGGGGGEEAGGGNKEGGS